MKRRFPLLLAKANASSDKNHLFRNVCLITIGLVLLTLPFVFSTSGKAQRGKLLTIKTGPNQLKRHDLFTKVQATAIRSQ